MDNRPIGVFDSGVGGLTVLKELKDLLKGENFIYFGDTARVPYGTKSSKTVVRYSIENTKLLMGFDVKLVVVACNTSSSYALSILNNMFDIPVVGVVKPGAQAAVKVTKNKKVGVIGTEATVKSNSYKNEILSLNSEINVFQKACPLFVPLIEEGWLNDEVTKEVAKRYLKVLVNYGVDTVVLGCTHYPLIKNLLKEIHPNLNFVDSAKETAFTVKNLLEKSGKLSLRDEGEVKILVSDKNERFINIANMIMGKKFPVEEVSICECES